MNHRWLILLVWSQFAAMSYGGMVSEMGKQYKAHGPHQPGPRGLHMTPPADTPKVKAKADDFGAGIL